MATSRRELPPQSILYALITGYHLSSAVHAAARLGLADLMAAGPRPAADLAAATNTHVPSLTRMLRLLVNAGVFTENEQNRFGLTSVGECLRTDAPNSMHPAALLWGGRPQIAWNRLLRCVETGKPAFNRVFGADPFQYMSQHSEDAEIFDAGMAALTRHTAGAVAAAYGFPEGAVLVDVGGGNGTLLAGILEVQRSLQGIVFDVQHVVERATRLIRDLHLEGRCSVAGGNFFEAVPSGGDVYILANVLTDWYDNQALSILKACHDAMSADSKLLIIEPVYPERIDTSPEIRMAVSTDVNVMVCTGGRTRSEQEFRSLLEAAGFTLKRIVPTPALICVLEAVAN